jgi:hypothetical protein
VAQNQQLGADRPDGESPTNDRREATENQPSTCPICNRNLIQFLKIRSYEFSAKKPEWNWETRTYVQDPHYMKLDNLCSSDYELLRALKKRFPNALPQELIEHAKGYRVYHPLSNSHLTREDKIDIKLGNYHRRQNRREANSSEIEAFLRSTKK